jgi:hypothetical protein
MRESLIEAAVTEYAKSRGWIARKCAWIGRRSAPDRLFSHPDRGPLWIEFKATGEKPRIHQEREIARMRKAGMRVFVIDDIARGKAVFD